MNKILVIACLLFSVAAVVGFGLAFQQQKKVEEYRAEYMQLAKQISTIIDTAEKTQAHAEDMAEKAGIYLAIINSKTKAQKSYIDAFKYLYEAINYQQAILKKNGIEMGKEDQVEYHTFLSSASIMLDTAREEQKDHQKVLIESIDH